MKGTNNKAWGQLEMEDEAIVQVQSDAIWCLAYCMYVLCISIPTNPVTVAAAFTDSNYKIMIDRCSFLLADRSDWAHMWETLIRMHLVKESGAKTFGSIKCPVKWP